MKEFEEPKVGTVDFIYDTLNDIIDTMVDVDRENKRIMSYLTIWNIILSLLWFVSIGILISRS